MVPREMREAPRKEYLHIAYDRICALCETLAEQPQTSAEDELLMDLATVTAQALDCINNEKAESTFLKLGYPLIVLLNELLAYRFDIDISPQESANTVPGITAEIGDETPLVKEELLDEPEQEPPLADLFCPATGGSRPVHRARCRPSGSEFIPSSSATTNRNTTTNNVDGVITWNLATCLANSTEGKINWDMATKLLEGEPFLPPEKECYLCGTVTNRYRSVPSARAERFIFLGSILRTSRREEVLVAALSASRATAHFCMRHISRTALARTPPQQVRAGTRPPYKRVQRSVKIFKNEVKRAQCDLCETPEFPIGITPKNPISCRRFLSSLSNLSPAQEAMIELTKTGNSIPNGISRICAKHFKKKMIRPGTEPNNIEQAVKEEDYDDDYPEPGSSRHI